jgi:hypothetical protein
MHALGDATGIRLFQDFNLVTFNYLIFGIVLAVMMVRRPEGLFPVEHAKAEMHGIGVSSDVTAVSATELSLAEEDVLDIEAELDAEHAAAGADVPPDGPPDRSQPEDRS